MYYLTKYSPTKIVKFIGNCIISKKVALQRFEDGIVFFYYIVPK